MDLRRLSQEPKKEIILDSYEATMIDYMWSFFTILT